MGFLDDLKDKAEEFGEKAKEGFGTAKDKASAIETPADEVGDVDVAPVDDPLDGLVEPVQAVDRPAQPTGTTTATDDPLESAPDRTV